MRKNITTLLGTIGLAVLLTNLWHWSQPTVVEYKVQTDTVTVEKTVTRYKEGSTIYVDRVVQVPVPVELDTTEVSPQVLAVLQDYHVVRTYVDTTQAEGGSSVSTITVSKNQLVGVETQLTFPVTTITTKETITLREKPRLQIWSGWSISSSMQAGVSLAVVTKGSAHYGMDVGVSFLEPAPTPYLGIRYMKRLR